MNHLFCFGYSYCAQALTQKIITDYKISATYRSHQASLDEIELVHFESLLTIPQSTTHILISIPPHGNSDLVLQRFSSHFSKLKRLQWIGYLSSTGVYGNHDGAWVNEHSSTLPTNINAINRLEAELQWQRIGTKLGVPTIIFRLAGIYGPGRSVFDRINSGMGQIITKESQYFSRIHVDDIAQAISKSMKNSTLSRIYNVADDLPSPPEEPMLYAYSLLQLNPPTPLKYDQADLSPMAMQFYADNKRVDNKLIKTELSISWLYPSYREGLKAIFECT